MLTSLYKKYSHVSSMQYVKYWTEKVFIWDVVGLWKHVLYIHEYVINTLISNSCIII